MAMTLAQFIRAAGGGAAVARRCGVTRAAVSHWVRAGEAPRQHHATLWQLALDTKLDWEPPGAEAIREKLAAAAPPAAA
jgi:transcriptional regulator with XRE-family HTH domain